VSPNESYLIRIKALHFLREPELRHWHMIPSLLTPAFSTTISRLYPGWRSQLVLQQCSIVGR
jgi:hypothetical protein